MFRSTNKIIETMAGVDRLQDFTSFTDVVNKFRSSSAKLEQIMGQLSTMKPDDVNAKPLVTEGALLILDLKSASRSVNLKVDSFRQHVQDYKKKLDNSQQQLQNLLYRKQHLVRELTLCHDFTVREVEKVEKDEGLFIVTNHDDLASNDLHQKRLTLLSDELTSRSKLEEGLKELTLKKKSLEESIDDSKTFLVGLPEQLRSIAGASQVLQRHFKLQGSEAREQYDRAARLSEPLYVLFRKYLSITLCFFLSFSFFFF
jgi:chaperonin cofactor prefoldin